MRSAVHGGASPEYFRAANTASFYGDCGSRVNDEAVEAQDLCRSKIKVILRMTVPFGLLTGDPRCDSIDRDTKIAH